MRIAVTGRALLAKGSSSLFGLRILPPLIMKIKLAVTKEKT